MSDPTRLGAKVRRLLVETKAKDEQLLREALKTLKIETARAHRWDNSGACYGQRPSCPSVHCAEARISITKLEERLSVEKV